MKTTTLLPLHWRLWLTLLLLTALPAVLADALSHGRLLVMLALGCAWFKGTLVAEHYMGLRYAPIWLRSCVHGWLFLVCGGLLLSFLLELP